MNEFDVYETEAEILEEKPVFSVYGLCANMFDDDYEFRLEIYPDDLRAANIGRKWYCLDQDRYPNRTKEWYITVTLVYINETKHTYYLHVDEDGHSPDRLVIVKLRR